MHICARRQCQRNAALVELELQLANLPDDVRSGVVIQARQDVWRAGDGRHAVFDEGVGHLQRNRQICRSVVECRQDVAVKIDHVDHTH